jgi:hypothetical protein
MGPGSLPGIAQLNARRGSTRHRHRDEQHRSRPLDLPTLNAEELRGAGTIEQHAEIGDVAKRADLLALNIDRADDLVERPVGKAWRLADRRIVHLGPQRLEALPLRHAPAGVAGALRVGARDIDMDAADLERVRGIKRQDPAVGRFQLRVDHAGKSEQGYDQQ